MNPKNIDRLFQEQLKNLKATPNKKVWNNIESKLKRKKRRVIPFWWLASGIAALFVLGLFLYPFSDNTNKLDNNNSKTIITEAPKEEIELKTIDTKSSLDAIIQNKNVEEKVLIADEKETQKPIEKKKNTLKKTDHKKELVSTKNAMKKIFLADNSVKKEIVNTKKENNNASKKNKEILSEKGKIEESEIEKKSSSKKVNLNTFIAHKDSILITKTAESKWAIAPVFGVLSSNSFSNSSPIDEKLANSTLGKSSFSYGVQVAYQINKKWTIQTGIHQKEMNYVNNQVSAVSASTRNGSSVVAFKNNATFSFENADNLNLTQSSIVNTPNFNGDLNQTFGYIEIPIEIKYNFLNTNKFDTQIVAGFSSLILNRNQINLNTQFLSQSGEANNLNNLNFSGNLGFDFNYLLNKNWSLNINPMFKAQLNTFSKNANGFSPFNIGIYTGIKYRF